MDTRPFSIWLFLFEIVASLIVIFGLLAWMAPSVWKVQIEAGWESVLATFLTFHLCGAFVEHPFHRYVLHASIIPGLSFLHWKHSRHHGLTHIVKKKKSGETIMMIENVYPIEKEEQHESSFFPWYAFLGFAIPATLIFSLVQWLLKASPIFLGGFLALAWSLFLYEVIHAIEHWPISKWMPLFHHKRTGWIWRKAYSFHLRHHADIRSNEGISGFFGLPIADWIFGTYVKAKTLYEDGSLANPKDFESPKPYWPIYILDKFVVRQRNQ